MEGLILSHHLGALLVNGTAGGLSWRSRGRGGLVLLGGLEKRHGCSSWFDLVASFVVVMLEVLWLSEVGKGGEVHTYL